MNDVSLLNQSPLCLTVDADSELIDAGLALAAKRKLESDDSTRELSELVDLVRETVNPRAKKHAATVFQYIDLAEVNEDLGAILSYRILKGELIGSSKARFAKGDILFAKIRPSIDNKKVALVFQELDNAVASTEFIVLRPKVGVSGAYLFAALRSDEFTQAVIDACGGDTGRQRIGPQKLLKIEIPWPDEFILKDISTKVTAYIQALSETMALEAQAREIAEDAVGQTSMRTAKPRRKRSKS